MFKSLPENIPDDKYIEEIWKPITCEHYENICPNRYFISSFGKLYDSYTGKILPYENYLSNKYVHAKLKLIDGSLKQLNIHQIVAKVFKPIRYENQIEIDHIDGVKCHNWVWNLDYVSHKENLDRAVKTGLYPLGQNHQNSIFSNEQIESVCYLISKGLTTAQIIDKLKEDIPGLSPHIIQDIKSKRNWKCISDKYDFSNMYIKEHNSLRMDEIIVNNICKAMEELGKVHPKIIADKIGIDIDSLNENDRNHFINCVHKLRRRVIFKDICNKYTY